MSQYSDKEALRRKYAAERDKRLRPDGNKQYVRLRTTDAGAVMDRYTPVKPRKPVTDHVTVALIGGGFAGLVTGARLKSAGIDSVRIIDKAGDFGGTWYWNRYPGAQCDTASFIYMPLLEETGYMPSEKYAHGPEILEHCRRIGNQFGLYNQALFHTEVTSLKWDEVRSHWIVRTNRGDEFTAQFVTVGTGPLSVPKLPGIPGIESFAGHSFHTSMWDYSYTGGDPNGSPMDKLADKRVAIIGTGATAVQCVPHLAKDAKELYVFQRTPSSVDVRNNQPTDKDWFVKMATPGWQQRWLESFASYFGPGMALEDLVNDGWTDLSKRIRARLANLTPEEFTQEGMLKAIAESDNEKMEEIRRRADEVVKDPITAEKLKAWYFQLCKRPCFHDEYLQSYNRPNTHLIDTNGRGVERITPTSVVVAGREYPVDCIIYASGFEVGKEYSDRNGFNTVGRDGIDLATYWSAGMRTLHGMYVHGFPNLFLVQPSQGAFLVANVPHNIIQTANTIALVIQHAIDTGAQQVEVTKEAEEDWLQLLRSAPPALLGNNKACTPGYYNNEGQDPEGYATLSLVGYPAGALAFFQYLEEWRNSGHYEGLRFI